MRVMLFGKNGQVGWELNRLLAPVFELIAFDRLDADLLMEDEIRELIRQYKPDVIINAAAYTQVDRAEDDELLAKAVNADAPGVMAEEAANLDAILIHYSTDYVFNGDQDSAYTELDKPDPVNAYGRSKLAGELAIQASGCRQLILRLSWVYSLRGHNFLLTMLRLANDRDEIKVVDDQFGAPTSARLIAEVTKDILTQVIGETATGDHEMGLYHLSSGGRVSWFEFAQETIGQYRLAGHLPSDKELKIVPITSDMYPTSATRPVNSCLDTAKLENEFNIKLPLWRDTLHQTMAGI